MSNNAKARPAEVVGHRLLHDRVGRDLPDEEREEADEEHRREPGHRDEPAEDQRPGTEEPHRDEQEPDRRHPILQPLRHDESEHARRSGRPRPTPGSAPGSPSLPRRGSSRTARRRTARTPRTGSGASGTRSAPPRPRGGQRPRGRPGRSCGAPVVPPRRSARRARAPRRVGAWSRPAPRSRGRRPRRARRATPAGPRRRRARTAIPRIWKSAPPACESALPWSRSRPDRTSGIAADFTASVTRITACAASSPRTSAAVAPTFPSVVPDPERDENGDRDDPDHAPPSRRSTTTPRAGVRTGRSRRR